MKKLKNFFLKFIPLILIFLSVETGNLIIFFVIRNQTTNFVQKISSENENSLIDPYFGYRAKLYKENYLRNQYLKNISSMGFFCGGSIDCNVQDEKYADYAIFGGSLAIQICDEFVKRNIEGEVIKCFALEAGKQPQQAQILSYLLVSGWKFKNIINIDGHNEIADGIRANFSKKVYPSFPFAWNERINNLKLLEENNFKDFIFWMKFRRIADKYRQNKFFTIKVASIIFSRYVERKLTLLQKSENNRLDLENDLLRNGPFFENDIEKYKNFASDLWINSSFFMENIASSNKAKYFHFLQPNQYIKNTKIYSEKEKKIAIKNPINEQLLNEMYPILIDLGYKKIKNFYSLTNIFDNNNETIYIDECCHINQKGKKIIFEEIIKSINNKNI